MTDLSKPEQDRALPAWIKLGLPLVASALLILHMALRYEFSGELGKGVDLTSLFLIGIVAVFIIARYADITRYIESANVPGFGEIKLRQAQSDIDELKIIVACLLTAEQAEALKRVHDGVHVFGVTPYRPRLTADLKQLMAIGMIQKKRVIEGKLTELAHGKLGNHIISDYFSLTSTGHQYYVRRLQALNDEAFTLPSSQDPFAVARPLETEARPQTAAAIDPGVDTPPASMDTNPVDET